MLNKAVAELNILMLWLKNLYLNVKHVTFERVDIGGRDARASAPAPGRVLRVDANV
jgi:hypothetical protein